MPVPDPFRQGLERGWITYDASRLEHDLFLEADIAVIGSGAGGATSAQVLSAAGFKVLLIEEGPLKTSSDFHLLESEAYASLYQEGLGRMSKDGAITILQGRAVGGTTLVNWTSSFRTPPQTLAHWASVHGVIGLARMNCAPGSNAWNRSWASALGPCRRMPTTMCCAGAANSWATAGR